MGRPTVNDLDLKVTAPDLTTHYWGNCGLCVGNWSIDSSVCSGPNPHSPCDPAERQVRDTVENVFVHDPQVGTWNIEVIASEIVEDGHVETGNDDVDFALVVSIDMDCNDNDTSDADDILTGTSEDCNENTIPDECDIAADPSLDCFNSNGVPDECDPFVPFGACCLSTTECVDDKTNCACTTLGGFIWLWGQDCAEINCAGY